MIVYFGTYTRDSESRGIYRAVFDPETGNLTDAAPAAHAVSPTFLTLHPRRPVLYAVDTDPARDEASAGAVSAFGMTPETGELEPLGQFATGTGSPCHITVDAAGRWLLFASYHDARAGVLALDADGVPTERTACVDYEGSGPHPTRQTSAHAHSINLSPDGHFAFVADLGTDRLMIYRFDAAAGTLAPHTIPHVSVRPGAGPRHFTFHPSGRWAYLINELDATIVVFAYDAAAGRLDPIQTVPALPPGFEQQNTAAEIAVHPNGNWLYGSNRGHDSLVRYAPNPVDGMLSQATWTSTRGNGPRHFAIHPGGRHLLVANQQSGNVVVLSVDPATGTLHDTGCAIDVPQPVCVRFAR